jgi:hypothetical protein
MLQSYLHRILGLSGKTLLLLYILVRLLETGVLLELGLLLSFYRGRTRMVFTLVVEKLRQLAPHD